MHIDELNTVIKQNDSFSELDCRFADMIVDLEGKESGSLWFAAALTSQQTRKKHICLDLTRLQEAEFALNVFGDEIDVTLPPASEVEEVLQQAQVVGQPGDTHPLILDNKKRLYLYRYWQYETRLAEAIIDRAKGIEKVDARIKSALKKYFTVPAKGEIDWQQVAAVMALSKRFCVISGGPGTGKTRTIGIILALLIEQMDRKSPAIKLAAPTGKAAVRLQESIKTLKEENTFSTNIRNLIPEEASTLHRLLGYKRFFPYFRHDSSNPLDADIVVVDEASMVAQPLMAKLMQALPEHARLILLGDQSQLASVEAGSALADICEAGNNAFSTEMADIIEDLTGVAIQSGSDNEISAMSDSIVELQKNYRFEGSGILELSLAVNATDSEKAMSILNNPEHKDVSWHQLNAAALKRTILERITGYPESLAPQDAFKQFEQFRILCALRHGLYGITQINAMVDEHIRHKQNLSTHDTWYAGQPVLITRNDYNLKLFNGDVGLILPDPDADMDLRAFFPVPEGGFKKVRPFRLPEYELGYAMTVHKSQGSEFGNVLLVLPEDDSPVLTCELIYTAITRTSQNLEVWGQDKTFRAAVSRPSQRSSGLSDLLRKPH